MAYAARMHNYAPPTDPLTILHHDHEILLVDKPSGLLSVPGKGAHLSDCLIKRVQRVFPEALLVHRLDRDTSGVMVFALPPPTPSATWACNLKNARSKRLMWHGFGDRWPKRLEPWTYR